ncbi:MAG: protease modulator HflC [Deltaproteobacteria bacterium]|nr:protease modulator HflC [Deltaproteobacteria bacterium]
MLRLISGIVFAALLLVPQFVFTIGEQEQGIIVQLGDPKRIVQEPGLYLKLPFIQNLVRLEKRILTTDARTAEYLTLDKKRVMVDQVSRWRIAQPLDFFRSVRDFERAQARVDDNISARLRQEIAAHNFLDLVRQKREEIMATVTKDVRETVKPFGIELIDVRVKQVDLPQEVQASVFARMRAERERIAKRYRAEGEEHAREIRAGADREREILLATAYETSQKLSGEGDAQASSIYASAFGQDPEFYAFTRRLQAYEKMLGSGTTLVLPSDSELLRYLQSAR